MRRADCSPLAGKRRREQLGSWERLPGAAHPSQERRDPGQEMRRRVLAYGLERCLTAGQREAVELCIIQGMSATRAAEQLGLAPSTMSRRLARALERLRELGALASAMGRVREE